MATSPAAAPDRRLRGAVRPVRAGGSLDPAGAPLLRGIGIGWRAELSLLIDRRPDLGFVELLAEHFDADRPLPAAIDRLCERGVARVVHSVDLSLGGAEPPAADRLRRIGRLANRTGAVLISEHLSFVRAGSWDSGHLLPLPRTRETLAVVIENIRIAQARLPVPLAIENIAASFEWPNNEMDEAQFLAEVLDACDAPLVLDLANLYANARNFGFDVTAFIGRLPLSRLAYVHVAGGRLRDGFVHDSHADPVSDAVFTLLCQLSARIGPVAAMLERDDDFPPDAITDRELDRLAAGAAGTNRVGGTAGTGGTGGNSGTGGGRDGTGHTPRPTTID